MSTDEDARPYKRPRTVPGTPLQSSTTGTSLNNLTRHPEFWLDDGSVILVARNTSFRVYRALLAAQSTVFADMFSSASPNTEEMLEGCPVVHLSDTPRDVAHFFRVLLPKSQPTLFSRKFRFTFHQIAAIIRLAHKYHVQAVFDQAVAALEEAFPSNFDTWERGEATVKFKEEHAICVINLTLLVDKPSLLPVALYRCALLGSDVLDGYKRNNKTIERLSMENIKRCIDGRNNLASRALGILLNVFNVGSCPECDTPDTCSPLLQSMLQWALEEEQSTETDVLQSWRGLIETWAPDTEICDYCEKALINRDVRARRRVWNDLPEIFDIEEEVGGWVADSSDFSD